MISVEKTKKLSPAVWGCNTSVLPQEKRKKRKTGDKKYIPFLLPSLAGVCLFVAVPFADSLRRSVFGTFSGRFCGADNYKAVLDNAAFRLAVKNTALFTAVCLPLLIVLSLMTALILSRLKAVRAIRSVLLFPLAVPTAAMVLVWRLLFDDHGMINGMLDDAGIGTVHFLDSKAAFAVLAASYIWKNLGYTVLLWLTGIMSISDSLSEAAAVDGAGSFGTLIYIILPNLRPAAYTITIISFLNSFKVFREAYLVAGAYPHDSIYLLQHLFNNWFANMELDKIAAATVMVFAVISAAVSLLRRVWDKEASS